MVEVEKKEVFEKLLDEHEDYLRNYALRLTTDPADADDLYQNTALRLWKYFDRFEIGTNFMAWSSRIMHNHFVNTWRKRNKWYEIEHTRTHDIIELSHSDEQVDQQRIQELSDYFSPRVHAALYSLNEGFRNVIILREVFELEYSQISEALDIPIGTVMSRLYRARRLLKDALEDRIENPKEMMAV